MTDAVWEVRTLRAGDVEAVFDLERRTEHAAHWNEEEYLRMVEPVAARGVQRVAYVAVQRSRVIGFIAGRVVLKDAEIENIAVEEEQQRRGIAAALVDNFVETCRRRSVTIIRLEVRESNAAAHALYRNAGFRVEATRHGYYHWPEEAALVLSKTVTAAR